MGRFIKYGIALSMLASMGFGLYQLRQIAEIKSEFDAGLPPEQALEKLIARDKTGVVGKIVAAHRDGMGRLDPADMEAAMKGDADAARRLSAMLGSASTAGAAAAGDDRTDAPVEKRSPSTITVLSADAGPVPEGPGVAVLIDEKTGERIVLRSSRQPPSEAAGKAKGLAQKLKAPSMPGIPKEIAAALGLPAPDSLQMQKLRAYALLGGTVLATLLLAAWARRRFSGGAVSEL